MGTRGDLQSHSELEERGVELTLTRVQAPRLYPALLCDSQPRAPEGYSPAAVFQSTIPLISAPSATTQGQSLSLHEKTQVQRGPEILFSQLKQPSLHHTKSLPAARKEEEE